MKVTNCRVPTQSRGWGSEEIWNNFVNMPFFNASLRLLPAPFATLISFPSFFRRYLLGTLGCLISLGCLLGLGSFISLGGAAGAEEGGGSWRKLEEAGESQHGLEVGEDLVKKRSSSGIIRRLVRLICSGFVDFL